MRYSNMKVLVLFILLASSLNVFGASTTKKAKRSAATTQATPVSLREKALSESIPEPASKSSAKAAVTDAQVNSSYLRLEDPRPKIITRNHKYNLGLQLTRWTPQGEAVLPAGTTMNLATTGSTVMPTVSFGFLRELHFTSQYLLNWGGAVAGAYSSQAANFTLPSGYKIEGSRLNTTIVKLLLPLQAKTADLKDLALTLTPQVGALNYTQAGVDSLANFSKQTTFTGLGLEIAYNVDPNVALTLETISNQELGSQNIKVQSRQINLGTQVIW